MKNTLLCIVVLSFFSGFAQEETTEENPSLLGNNEIKVNAAYLVAGIPEISYERILSDDTSLGVALVLNANSYIDYDFLLIPYGRLYFGQKRNAGFFLEGNAAVYTEEASRDFFESGREYKEGSQLGLGLGLGIGAKFLTRSGWVGEILGGLGRNFINTDYISELYPRLGISLGKRF